MAMKKRNSYSMHHQTATMGYIGAITPFMMCEVAPGDTWQGNIGQLLRLAPLKNPFLMDMYVDKYIFYVPHRLVDDQWEDFIAQGPNPESQIFPPTTTTPNPSLFQVDGNHPGTDPSPVQNWNAYRLRTYNLIFNEFFRDQEAAPKGADEQPPDLAEVQTGEGRVNTWYASPKRHYWNELRAEEQVGIDATAPVLDPGGTPHVQAEDILQALAEQKLQMRRATYGTRYVDILKSFGVRVNYQMLQRPEVVAVNSSVMNITDVISTGAEAELGKQAGYGINGSRVRLKRKAFPEHGTLMGVVVVRPPFTDYTLIDYMDKQKTYASYYDPGLELLPRAEVYPSHVLGPEPLDNATKLGNMAWFEWYRMQTNRVHEGLREWTFPHMDVAAENWEQTTIHLYDNLVNGLPVRNLNQNNALAWQKYFVDETAAHYRLSSVMNLRALRLVKKGNPGIHRGST